MGFGGEGERDSGILTQPSVGLYTRARARRQGRAVPASTA